MHPQFDQRIAILLPKWGDQVYKKKAEAKTYLVLQIVE